jgi:SAM-dependent methyltransferase
MRVSVGITEDREGFLPQFIELLEASAGREAWCLDIGCGSGGVALALAQRVRWIVGIDREPERISAARARAESEGCENARFLVADAESGGYAELSPPGAFDLIVANLCLTDSIIRNAAEALVPGGRLVAACQETGNQHDFERRTDHAYTEGRLKAVLHAAGLDVEQLEVIPTNGELNGHEQWHIGHPPREMVRRRRKGGRFRALEGNCGEGIRIATKRRIVFSARKRDQPS